MALGLSLAPITKVMQPDHAERASHPDKHAKIDKEPFDQGHGSEGTMDQQPMHADRVTTANGDSGQHNKYNERVGGKRQRTCDERSECHSGNPRGLHGFKDNISLNRIGSASGIYAFRGHRLLHKITNCAYGHGNGSSSLRS